MGMHHDEFRFTGALPDLVRVRAEVVRRGGSDLSIDGLFVNKGVVVADVLREKQDRTRELVWAVLQEAGGEPVNQINPPPRK